MKKFIVALLALFLFGCSLSKEELDSASLICKAENSSVEEVDALRSWVACADGKYHKINSENTYNAMMLLSRKGEL